jgi:hypothetical protein
VRKLLWIVLVVLFVAIGAPKASADTYEVTFTCRSSLPNCTYLPPTSPNVVLLSPNLSGFVMSWRGVTVPLAFPPVSDPPSNDAYTWDISVNTRGDLSGTFVTASICNDSIPSCISSGNYTDPYGDPIGTSFTDGGPVVFSLVATPEPGSIVLMLTGVGLLGLMMVMRKRHSPGHQLAT